MRIKVDPVTRIEGHLRLEAEVSGGTVSQAWASGTMFRGMEIILRGRDPREAWIWAQRICGVCTTVHALASVRAVENALGIEIPPNANLVRNLIAGTQTVHDHVVHFYHLHALDWVDITGALKADPAKTSRLAQSISNWPQSGTDEFAATKQRVKTLVDSGQLSLFASGYWGHPAYRLPPEANLLAVDHYLQALEWQRDVIRVHAVLGGKNPHPQTYLVGGMATPLDLDSPQAINQERIDFMRARLATMREFVEQVYLPDVLLIASAYKDWFGFGGNTRNFMAYGGIPLTSINDPATYFFPRGIVFDRDLSTVHPFDETKVTEQVAHSYYEYTGGNSAALNPFHGQTNPAYTGPQPPYEWLNTDAKYSWLKSPRYDGQAMEVGPLARTLIAYASGNAGGAEPGRRCVEGARCRAGRAVLDARESGRSGHRERAARPGAGGLARSARVEPGSRRPAQRGHDEVGSGHVAESCRRVGMARASARLTRSLGRDRQREDRELPGGGSDDVELRVRATRAASRAHTSRRWSACPWRIRRARWSCCARSTRSIRAWLAQFTSSTPSVRRKPPTFRSYRQVWAERWRPTPFLGPAVNGRSAAPDAPRSTSGSSRSGSCTGRSCCRSSCCRSPDCGCTTRSSLRRRGSDRVIPASRWV